VAVVDRWLLFKGSLALQLVVAVGRWSFDWMQIRLKPLFFYIRLKTLSWLGSESIRLILTPHDDEKILGSSVDNLTLF